MCVAAIWNVKLCAVNVKTGQTGRMSEGGEWLTVCVLSAEGTEWEFGLHEDGAPAVPKHVRATVIL
jgi:hypothetical protein